MDPEGKSIAKPIADLDNRLQWITLELAGLGHGFWGRILYIHTYIYTYIIYILSIYIYIFYCRRKFRSQTSDNMNRWKSRGGKSQKKEGAGARKGRKVGIHYCMFFQWFVALEGRKVGSLKRRLRSHLAGSEMKNCTPLWREAHFELKKLKTPHVRSTISKLKCTPVWRCDASRLVLSIFPRAI